MTLTDNADKERGMAARIFICGASARSAAQSACRNGLRVIGADLFGDIDLHACGVAIQSCNYPFDLLKVAEHLPPCEWMYTGGLENQPDLVRAISRRHHLLGNGVAALTQVRNPWQLTQALRDHDLLFPESRPQLDSAAGRMWLSKPFASCGGTGIRRVGPDKFAELQRTAQGRAADGQCTDVHGCQRESSAIFYQAFVSGESYSANFTAANGSAELLGVTRQLVGCDWTGARDFQYCGSIGPVPLEAGRQAAWQRIGDCLAARFELQGLFGVDSILSGNDLWVIEVNPRFCASVELLERSLGCNGVAIHREACLAGRLPRCRAISADRLSGKAILYADRAVRISATLVQNWIDQNRAMKISRLADLPRAGTAIPAGHPVLTVFAEGWTSDDVLEQLKVRVDQVRGQVDRAP